MTDVTTAYLIGGPKDGEFLALPHAHQHLALCEPDLPRWRHRDFLENPLEVVPAKTTYYHRRSIALFGSRFDVFVHEDIGLDDLTRIAVERFLSPLAQQLVRIADCSH